MKIIITEEQYKLLKESEEDFYDHVVKEEINNLPEETE